MRPCVCATKSIAVENPHGFLRRDPQKAREAEFWSASFLHHNDVIRRQRRRRHHLVPSDHAGKGRCEEQVVQLGLEELVVRLPAQLAQHMTRI